MTDLTSLDVVTVNVLQTGVYMPLSTAGETAFISLSLLSALADTHENKATAVVFAEDDVALSALTLHRLVVREANGNYQGTRALVTLLATYLEKRRSARR